MAWGCKSYGRAPGKQPIGGAPVCSVYLKVDRHGLLKNVQLLSSVYNKRRNFRSQTSDSMDRWKADVVRVKEEKRREEKRREEKRRGEERRGEERREEKKKEDQKRESLKKEKVSEERRSRRKKIQVREKVAKPSQNTVFFKWFVAPEGRKVGSLKRRVRSQLARWDMTIARRCGAKHISKSKCIKHTSSEPLLEVEMSKKCTPLWHEAHFEVKMRKTHQVRTTLGTKNDGMRATEDLQRCIFRGRRSTRDMFIRAARRSGRWFPENGCILEPQIFRFAEMILRDRSSTSYDLASLFRGRRSS